MPHKYAMQTYLMTKLGSVAPKLSHAHPPMAKGKKAHPSTAHHKTAASDYKLGTFDIGSIRKQRGFAAQLDKVLADGISGNFPLEKLSSIKTPGRHGVGFRLDGGSVRFLWVSARRIEESGNKGYEIFFWAQGKAIGALAARLKHAGAKKSTFSFTKAEPNGKDALVRKKQHWSSDTDTALTLKKAGHWSVELNPGEPEALRGATRIKVWGTDAEAKKAMEEVQNKLGLQSVFAPSTPSSLERFKLMRMLWVADIEAARKLSVRPFSEIGADEISHALDGLSGDGVSKALKAYKTAKLSDPEVHKRLRLAELLVEKDPEAFVDWANGLYSERGILPDENQGWDPLGNKLSELKIGEQSAAYKKALGKKHFSAEEARPLLEFGLIAKEDTEAARALLARDTGNIPLEDIKAALHKAGVSPDGARMKKLRFEEVYPGYFTVVDPELAERCKKAGARYLYSTYDDADRVISMLEGGQKSSLVRFHEGLIIEGKSSSADFGTGGAQAVFTRLVTASAIAKAKKKSGSDWETKFNDWGGSRPYKVILNPTILGRTDWWGANSDTFGNSKELSKENLGEAIVKEINKSYSSSNELMFPIGNDPAYADFVVCGDEDEKKALMTAMKKAGFHEYNGKTLDEFVRVEEKLFEHSDA